MDPFIKIQKSLKLEALSLKATVDQHAVNPLDETAVEEHLEKITNLRRQGDRLKRDIMPLCADDAEIVQRQLDYDDIENLLSKLKITLVNIGKTFATTGPSAPIPSSSCDVKLPKLDLPTFNGDVQQWLSFHDLFVASIVNNAKLSGAQKLQYLKASVKGEPSQLIQSIELTDANFDEAWHKLINRYQNIREIIKSHLDRYMSFPNLTQENPSVLRKLVDTTAECARALDILKIPRENIGDLFFIHILLRKLDSESRLQFEKSLKDDEIPNLEDCLKFLDRHARVTAAAGSSKPKPTVQSKPSPFVKVPEKRPTVVHHGATKISCVLCSGDHFLFKCEQFHSKPIPDRLILVKDNRLCYNCLMHGHSTKDCKNQYRCKECKSMHHSLLHLPKSNKSSAAATPEVTVTTHLSSESRNFANVLLSTALINVKDCFGKNQVCRALVDNGSMTSIISESCAQRLKLDRKNIHVPISGVGAVGAGTSKGFAKVQISSCISTKFAANLNMLILPKITSILPHEKLNYSSWTHIENLKLADPKYYEPGSIDILLGNDVFADLLCTGKIKGPEGTPTAIETVLGWILGGPVRTEEPSVRIHLTNYDLDTNLQKFWEIEELPKKRFLTPEEESCEKHFAETHSRDETGRYVVKLPFKNDIKPLGESRNQTVSRLKQVERRLSKNSDQQDQYNQVIQEYLDLNHMEEIQPGDIKKENVYYLPHHAVFKESTTTQLRVVFDASAKSTSGASLNDNLMTGPKLQDDLISILMRFRTHPIAITADIAKMYRQFRVDKDDTDYQRIVWRKSPEDLIRDYRLLTATFGTASAPYLAIKCVQQLAKDEAQDFLDAAEILQRDLYVDDLMSGAENEEDAINLQNQLRLLTQRGRLELRKWSSNSTSFLQSLPPDLCETKAPLRIDLDESIKTLGLHWHPAADCFQFSVLRPQPIFQPTKRSVASAIAKVFDPLGWPSPVTINSKILLQEMWKRKLDWDEPLPEDLNSQYRIYQSELPAIEDIQIDRCITKVQCGVAPELVPKGSIPLDPKSHPPSYHLYGFCDSSEKAYAAVVYLQTRQSHQSKISIVASKTKVAPLKTTSLPRLELCGAVLLSRLLETVQESHSNLTISDVHGWTDSTIVLAWLASPPHRWKTFVANRVAEVQETLPSTNWHHVRSAQNPADFPSRGISPSELKDLELWWNGPDFLSDELQHGNELYEPSEEALKEERQNVVVHISTMDFSLLERYSSLNKLKRITAYMLRFINNCRQKDKTLRVSGQLTPSHLDAALNHWIKLVQSEVFHDEVLLLNKKFPLPSRCKILSLNPFIDASGLLRVGGRLRNANITIDKKYPILLPRKHPLTHLIIQHYHIVNLHAGPQALLSAIQERFWIICGRDVVRHYVQKCVTCFRLRADGSQQMMGDFPAARVNPGRAFIKCGVDYAGPFNIRISRGDRSTRRQPIKTQKAYLAIFVCFSTRAVHLELVSDMTTEAFIAAFKRFISRRGKCSDVYSDCGSNFVGAKNEFKDILQLLKSSQFNADIQQNMANDGINWHLNPPSAPHFGGLWEAGVKSVKYHLRRIVGNNTLTFEELYTVLTQIEACLNSRPITASSSNPDDLTALTPAHFLIGDTFSAVPEADLTGIPINRLSQWQKTQQYVQHFWNRWSSEFLSRLQQRPKWLSQKENIVVGDLVLIKDDTLPPLKWKMGRVLELYPGKDNIVRVALIKTSEGIYQRPITKLAPLPIDKDI